MTGAHLKTVFTVRHGSKKKKKKVTVTEVHGMQNLDMKLKLHTMFFFIIYDLCFCDQCVVLLNKSLQS